MRPNLKGGNFCTTAGALTATGTVTTHDTTVSIQYAINGKAYICTAITTGATPTTDYNTGATFTQLGALQGTVVVWALNAAGAVKCMMGSIETLNADSTFFKRPTFPAVPNNVTPFAYQVLKVDSTGSAIAFGTSNWDATGFTNAVVDVHVLPNRPQIS